MTLELFFHKRYYDTLYIIFRMQFGVILRTQMGGLPIPIFNEMFSEDLSLRKFEMGLVIITLTDLRAVF